MATGKNPNHTHVSIEDWRTLHLWQFQPIRDALLLATLIGIVMLGYKLSIVTVPLLLAMALAYLFEPLVRKLVRRNYVSRPGVAIGIIVVAFVAVVVPAVFGIGFAVVQGVSYSRQLVTNVQKLQISVEKPSDPELLEALPPGTWRSMRDYIVQARMDSDSNLITPALENLVVPPEGEVPPVLPDEAERRDEPEARDAETPDGAVTDEEAASRAEGEEEEPPVMSETATTVEEDSILTLPPVARSAVRESTAWLFSVLQANAEAIGKFVGRQALGTGTDAARAAIRFVTSTGYVLFMGFLTAFFFYFFCTEYGRLLRFWESLIPERKKSRIFDLLTQMDAVIAGFIRGRLTICAILVVYFTIAYWAIGTPAPLILGPIIGILSLLPYVAGLGMPVAMVLMALQPEAGWQTEWWWVLLGPILVTCGAQFLDDYILTPTIQGKSTGMDTPTILFASIAGGALAGVYGLLLAIPVAACVKILLREVVWPQIHRWAEGRASDPLPIDSEPKP